MALSNNQRIINYLEKRLEFGAKEHGKDLPLDKSRNHLQDALEEVLDLSIYLTAKILELKGEDEDSEKGILADCRSEEEIERDPYEW